MSRGMSFEPTKQEREAANRRERVQRTVLKLLGHLHSVSTQDVFVALDHLTPPAISPANSGNILALLAREGLLVAITGVKVNQDHRSQWDKVLYTLPPRREITLPVYDNGSMKPLTKQDLMVGKARPRRERYVSMMDAPPCVEEVSPLVCPTQLPNAGTDHPMRAENNKIDAPLQSVASAGNLSSRATHEENIQPDQDHSDVTLRWPNKTSVTSQPRRT